MWQLFGQFFYDAALAVSCAIAILLGGRDERITAGIAVAASAASAVTLPLVDALGLSHARYAFLAINLATLFLLDRVMVGSHKTWPIVATGFQIADVVLEITAISEPAMAANILFIQGKFAYPILLALLVGSLRHRFVMRRT